MEFPGPEKHCLPHTIRLHPPTNFENKELVQRFSGSLVGLAVGDALGASVEFRPHQYFVDHPVKDMEGGGTWGLKPGQWTDDTSMALCLAASLINKEGYDPYDQMVRYKWWYRYGYLSSTGHCFDIGNATRDSLEEFISRQKKLYREFKINENQVDLLSWDEVQAKSKFDVNCSGDSVAGNGALMRLAPIPLFFHRYPELAVEYAGRSARLTHGDTKAVDACRYYAALIVAAIQGQSKGEILSKDFYRLNSKWFGPKPLHQEIKRIAEGSYQKRNGYDDGIRGKGYIVNALEAALWAFWDDGNSFKNGALMAVNLGDDTDTTAAIYGQLAGAYYGCSRIPKEWREKVYAFGLLESVGQILYFKGNKYNRSSRDNEILLEAKSLKRISSTEYEISSNGNSLSTYSYNKNQTQSDQVNEQRRRAFNPARNDFIPYGGQQDLRVTRSDQFVGPPIRIVTSDISNDIHSYENEQSQFDKRRPVGRQIGSVMTNSISSYRQPGRDHINDQQIYSGYHNQRIPSQSSYPANLYSNNSNDHRRDRNQHYSFSNNKQFQFSNNPYANYKTHYTDEYPSDSLPSPYGTYFIADSFSSNRHQK